MPKDLKDTLNLPKTEFPMRANLVAREPERLGHWEHSRVYERLQEKNADGLPFILHDGPPFTNGDVHIGTALNKTLKDILVRFHAMRGRYTPYVPGWDCHGLPIEHKVAQERQKKKEPLDPISIRRACATFSAGYIEKQRGQFRRLGILADWAREYKTMNPAYEADILRTFAVFVEKGLVYRSKKPVYWSIPCQTALAEAEIEYKDHTSPSIWVKFAVPAEAAQRHQLPTDKPLSIVIWTTTPWTLPANLAIAVHPQETYAVLDQGDQYLLLAEKLQNALAGKIGGPLPLVQSLPGAALEGLQAQHPFIARPSPVLTADYVTMDSGTGCVHTAPGHGLEDYLSGLRHGLDIYCPLNDHGCYQDDGQIPPALVGLSVLEKAGQCPANNAVIALLKDSGALLHAEPHQHQYPHCWRSKSPVIFRAMDQWFVSLDKEQLREQTLEALSQVAWIPQWGENRIRGAVQTRPDWCISRQRAWGVPLPVFFRQSDGAPLLDAHIIRALADKVATEGGTDIWFERTPAQLLAGMDLPAGFEAEGLQKGNDTLDVWLDSGCSHRAVLQTQEGLHWPADMYLEGSDQHRGWFQSSLWTAMIADGRPPYKTVLTHGFIVDEQKRKISKSDGKPQTADGYVAQYGADILRLWIASEDYRSDIPLSDNILNQIVNTYRTLRNTLRFQLGNLHDFDPTQHALQPENLQPLDRWALHKIHQLHAEVTAAYEACEFHRVFQLINRYCTVTLSATWHDILKDRLYTHGPDSPSRRSAQTVIHHTLQTLLRLLAPILPFTTDEAFAHLQNNTDFAEQPLQLEPWPSPPPEWQDPTHAEAMDTLLRFRDRVNEQLEALRQRKEIGQSLDARIVIQLGPDDPSTPLLRQYQDSLPEIFIVSQVVLEDGDGPTTLTATHALGQRCPRCWRWEETLVAVEGYDTPLCPRCRDALLSRST